MCRLNQYFCLLFRVKIHEIANLQETPSVIMLDEEVLSLGYSEDGQLLALATSSGRVSVHLSRLPMLAAAHINKIAILSSLSQITLYQLSFEKVLLLYVQKQSRLMT